MDYFWRRARLTDILGVKLHVGYTGDWNVTCFMICLLIVEEPLPLETGSVAHSGYIEPGG